MPSHLSHLLHKIETNFILFSDSMSSLESLEGFKVELDLVQKVIKDYTDINNSGKTIRPIFRWILNIPGSERADAAAKSSLSLPITSTKLPGCNLIPLVSKFCLEEWQDIWNCCPGNKLHAIYPTVGSPQHSQILFRHEQTLTNFDLVILALHILS